LKVAGNLLLGLYRSWPSEDRASDLSPCLTGRTDPSLRFSLSRFVKEKEEGMGFGWNREIRERYVFVRELKRGGKKGEGELLEQRCLRKRKRRGRKGEGKTKEEEKRKRGCRPKWREREKKRKERGRDKVMCHHVSSWEKMRQSSL
jgi:hypothetical protein